MASLRGHVHHADVEFTSDADTRAPGGAVTVALCGSWDHEGSCRWPHHTSVDPSLSPSPVRVVYAVADDELADVRGLIEGALTRGDGWHAVAMHDDVPTADEAKHVAKLRGE
jgi:hypothetical protein